MILFTFSSLFYSLLVIYLTLNRMQKINTTSLYLITILIALLNLLNIRIINECSIIQYIFSIFGAPSLVSFFYIIILLLNQFGKINWVFSLKDKLFLSTIIILFYLNYSNFLSTNLFYLDTNMIGICCLILALISFIMNNILGYILLSIILFHTLFLPQTYNLFLCIFDPLLLFWLFLNPKKLHLNDLKFTKT